MHRIADCGGRTPVEQMWRPGYERYAPQGGDLGAVASEAMARQRQRRCWAPTSTGPNRPEDVAKALNSLCAATVVAH
jgi:hypothetical protein